MLKELGAKDFDRYIFTWSPDKIFALHTAASSTMKQILKTNFKQPVKIKRQKTVQEKLDLNGKLYKATHPYYLQSQDGKTIKPLNTIDCIMIYLHLEKIKRK